MRVLVIQPTADKRGHYGIYTTRLCHALGGLGHDVTLCTNRLDVARYVRGAPAFSLWEVGGGRFAFEGFDEALGRFPLKYYWAYFRNSYAITAAGLRRSLREPFDAVAIMDAEFTTASLLLRRRSRSAPPVIMFLWATNFSFAAYSGSIVKRAYKVLQRRVFRRTLGQGIQALAVLDEWHRDRLRPQLGLPLDFPIEVIPDGGDPSPEMPSKAAARAALGLPADGTVFLFFGVLRKDKGIESLLRAASLLRDVRDVTVVVAGWPMEYSAEEIRRMAAQSGLEGRLVLRLGYVPDEDVPTYFAACDALVLPYAGIYTGGSGPLMKGACTYGRPVVATRVSGMGSLVADYGIGLVDDPRSLGAAMREFASLPEPARAGMAARATALAAANSWESLAGRLADLVRRVASR
jgi:glycosyltransferase involved in cell wall biosynthesis